MRKPWLPPLHEPAVLADAAPIAVAMGIEDAGATWTLHPRSSDRPGAKNTRPVLPPATPAAGGPDVNHRIGIDRAIGDVNDDG